MVYFLFTYVSSCLEQIRKKILRYRYQIQNRIFFFKNASFTIEIEKSDLKLMRKVNKRTKEIWLIVMFKHFTDRLVWRCKVLFDPDFIVYQLLSFILLIDYLHNKKLIKKKNYCKIKQKYIHFPSFSIKHLKQ